MNNRKRKKVEPFFIAVKHPALNEQKDSKNSKIQRFNVIQKWCDLIGNLYNRLSYKFYSSNATFVFIFLLLIYHDE